MAANAKQNLFPHSSSLQSRPRLPPLSAPPVEPSFSLADRKQAPEEDLTAAQIASTLTEKVYRGISGHRFQQGLFFYRSGNYSAALSEFEKARSTALRTRDHSRFIESSTHILQIANECEESELVKQTEHGLLEILASVQLEPQLLSRLMYALGLAKTILGGACDEVMDRFREAIDFAVLAENKLALAAPLLGAANILYSVGRYEDALKQLGRLEILLTCLDLPDLVSASRLLRAKIKSEQGLLDEALCSAWEAFESLKHRPNLVLYLNTLCLLGKLFSVRGDLTSARIYLDLADRTVQREELPRIAKLIDSAMSGIGRLQSAPADLKFDTRTGVLIAKTKGEIHFEGQFVLRDLLIMFLEYPGRVFTKEQITLRVWKETYSPLTHDNKIYVTIKRLRRLLEAGDGAAKEYILRGKTGYFVNPKIRISIDDQIVEPSQPGTVSHRLPPLTEGK